MKTVRGLVLILTVSTALAGLVPAAAVAEAGTEGNAPTVYLMTFIGFEFAEAEAVMAVMRDEFPGFTGLLPSPRSRLRPSAGPTWWSSTRSAPALPP